MTSSRTWHMHSNQSMCVYFVMTFFWLAAVSVVTTVTFTSGMLKDAMTSFSASASLNVLRQEGRGVTTDDVGGNRTKISCYVEDNVH